MTATTQTAPVAVPPFTGLNASDRCDSCGAEAYTQAILNSGDHLSDLKYCAHHFVKHEAKLRKIAIAIHDERHKLQKT